MSDHHFNSKIAQKYGVQEAIFLNNIKFWTVNNIANQQNYRDGLYWTFNSYESFSELFNYWSAYQIKHIIKKCIDAGLLIKSKYNKNSYDKTNWYALTPLGLEELEIDKNAPKPAPRLIRQNYLIDKAKLPHRTGKIPQPIPDNKTHIINTDCVGELKQSTHTDFKFEKTKKEDVGENHLQDPQAIRYFNDNFSGRDITLGEIHAACCQHYASKGVVVTQQRFMRWLKNERVDNYKKVATRPDPAVKEANAKSTDELHLLLDYKHWLNKMRSVVPLDKWVPNADTREKMVKLYQKEAGALRTVMNHPMLHFSG